PSPRRGRGGQVPGGAGRVPPLGRAVRPRRRRRAGHGPAPVHLLRAARVPVLGTVVVAGVAFEVTEIRLTGGRFVIIACHPGPVPGLRGPATLFGADGK